MHVDGKHAAQRRHPSAPIDGISETHPDYNPTITGTDRTERRADRLMRRRQSKGTRVETTSIIVYALLAVAILFLLLKTKGGG